MAPALLPDTKVGNQAATSAVAFLCFLLSSRQGICLGIWARALCADSSKTARDLRG
jgi:hypothetical protein